MGALDRLTGFINSVASDERLKPVHISLYCALCHTWIVNNFQRRFHVSRKRLMALSRIRSRTTYHKVMDDLNDFGYLCYQPSYHPVKGSMVSLLGIRDPHQGTPTLNHDRPRYPTTLVKLDEYVKQGAGSFSPALDDQIHDLDLGIARL